MIPTNGSRVPKSVVRVMIRAALAARLLLLAAIERGIHELTDHVADQDVRFLDARRLTARRHVQPVVDHRAELAAGAAGKTDRVDAEPTTGLDAAKHVRRRAARRERHRNVPRLA